MRRALTVHHGLNFERTIPVFLILATTVFNSVDYAGEDLNDSVNVGSESQTWSLVEDDPTWIMVIGESSPGDDDFIIRVAANSTGLPRSGTVTFSSSGCPDVVVTVNQLANPI